MKKTGKISALHKRFGEIPFLFLCLALWVAAVCLVLILAGKLPLLPGFLLGAAGSAFYGILLYRRVPALLNRPFATGNLKHLWWGWAKTLQPIVAIALVILAFSHWFRNISFLAALFGFLSFQISLFLYAILISIDS